MNLPVILPPPDGVTSEQMERDGWERQVEQRHRRLLALAHRDGCHTSPVEGCMRCAFEIALLCAGWYEPHQEIPRGFR